MADRTVPEGPRDRHPERPERRSGRRSLLALAALAPLAISVGAVATTATSSPRKVEHATAQSEPGASTRWCYGPLVLPDGALESGPGPSPAVALRAVSVRPESPLLFGRVSAAGTLQEDDGSVRAPSIRAEKADGTVIRDEPASQDLGFSDLGASAVEGTPHVTTATSDGGRPVADVIQATLTPSGDYHSYARDRCGEPDTEASFLGAHTAP